MSSQKNAETRQVDLLEELLGNTEHKADFGILLVFMEARADELEFADVAKILHDAKEAIGGVDD